MSDSAPDVRRGETIALSVRSMIETRITLTPLTDSVARVEVESRGLGGDTTKFDVPRADIADLLTLIRNLTVPATPALGAMGLDGVTYELTMVNGWARVTYSWWVRPPEGWEGLETVANHLIALARPHLSHPLTFGP